MARTTSRPNRYKEAIEFARNFTPVTPLLLPTYTRIPEQFMASPPEDDADEEAFLKVDPFEPQTFNDYVGQEQAKEVLKVIIEAANKEHRSIPNILLTGAFGHGKTTLAKLIAKHNNKEAQIIDGSTASLLVKPSRSRVYIIDEAHNIPPQTADSFNILIDAKELTIIACTTNPGKLSGAFKSRFRFIYLEEYNAEDLQKIISKASKRSKTKISKEATQLLAQRCKFNPRVALTILEFVREIGVVSNTTKSITLPIMEEALTKLGIDDLGLNNLDRKYLDLLREDNPVGLSYISSALSLDSSTVQDEIEPYLLRKQLIERTPRGRVKTSSTGAAPFFADKERISQIIEGLMSD